MTLHYTSSDSQKSPATVKNNASKQAEKSEPPHSNTGVPDATIDYLAGTLQGEEAPSALRALLGSDGWIEQEHGAGWYGKMAKKGNVTILWAGKQANMGTHFVMTGQGCREQEGREDFPGWPSYISSLLAAGVSLGRLDLALDDHGGLLSLPIIKEHVAGGLLVSSYRTARGMWERSLADGADSGETVYFGRRQSDSMMRFYEWGKKHGGDEQFIRCEIELHDKQAHAAGERLAGGASVGPLAASIMASKLTFKEAGEQTQKCRWETSGWWSAFLGAVEKVTLAVKPAAGTLSSKLAWLQKAVAPTLALLDEQIEARDWLRRLCDSGREKLKQNAAYFDAIRSAGWRSGYEQEKEADPFGSVGEEALARFVYGWPLTPSLSM